MTWWWLFFWTSQLRFQEISLDNETSAFIGELNGVWMATLTTFPRSGGGCIVCGLWADGSHANKLLFRIFLWHCFVNVRFSHRRLFCLPIKSSIWQISRANVVNYSTHSNAAEKEKKIGRWTRPGSDTLWQEQNSTRAAANVKSAMKEKHCDKFLRWRRRTTWNSLLPVNMIYWYVNGCAYSLSYN